MTETLRLYSHPCFLKHDTGPGHPERAARLEALFVLFDEKGWSYTTAHEADIKQIARAHDPRYIDKIEMATPDCGYAAADADTVLSPGSWEAALHAAGAVCQAVDDILSSAVLRAFCAVRPPGHHAFPDHAEGFCLFNNIFIGALHAQYTHDLKRIAILDFDVHHGNGSDAMARTHEGVFYASTHQWPLYPGTGLPESNVPGRIINTPLNPGDGSAAFRAAWSEKIFPELDKFAPELIFISAGFDAHKNDPLAQINLEDDDFGWITREIVKAADRHCGGRIVSVLEGGYDLPALTSGAAAHLDALI